MADIQPKNTDTIRVNTIKEKTAASGITLNNTAYADTILEKTASNGVRLNALVKVLTTGITPLISTADLGTTTVAEHFRKLYAQAVAASGQTLSLGTVSAHDSILQANSVAGLTLKGAASTNTPANRLAVRLGDTGFTSGGEIELFTANVTTTSTTPVTALTYTIPQTNTQVAFICFVQTRDNAAGTASFILTTISASRAGAGAVAGTVGSSTATNGTALVTMTVAVSGNDVLLKAQNVSGTNTTYTRLFVIAIPVSTST